MRFLHRMLIQAILPIALIAVNCRAAHALDAHVPLDDYNHAMWTAKDGAPEQIQSMAQTPDGWLWLGTQDGLYRYDGVKFERYPLPGQLDISRDRIYRLLALPNGDLWITYETGALSVLRKNGSVEDFVVPGEGRRFGFTGLAVDGDGSVWVASQNGIYHFVHGAWSLVQARQGQALRSDITLLLDQYGRLWAGDHDGVYLYERGQGTFRRLPQKEVRGSLAQSSDGRLWALEADTVHQVPAPSAPGAALQALHQNQMSSSWAGQFDHDGNLWKVDCPSGVCLVPGVGTSSQETLVPARQAISRLDRLWQLGTSAVNAVFEDREGNIWIASQAGLLRLRQNKLRPLHVPGDGDGFSIKRDAQGQIWADDAVTRSLWRVSPDGVPLAQAGHRYRLITNDRHGALLLAGLRTIERRDGAHVEQIPLPPGPNGLATDLSVAGVLDDGKVLWMASSETGLMGYQEGKWLPRSAFNLPPNIYLPAGAGPGQLWLAQIKGKLSFYDNGRLTNYDVGALGLMSGIFPGPEMVLSGAKGTAVLREGKLFFLSTRDPEVLRNISGLAITSNGDHWLNGAKGVIVVTAQDWRSAVQDPRQSLRYRLLGVLEGYPGHAALSSRQSSVLDAGNDQLWFRATGGIVYIDTRSVTLNRVAPDVQILRVNTGTGSYAPAAGLELPAGSRSLNIAFTAASLRQPESVQFEYRLKGMEDQWQAGGTRRTAFYTNVPSGSYTFEVRAFNEDGIPSAAPRTFAFSVAPTIVETAWFKVLCILAAGAFALGWYRFRLRRMRIKLIRNMTVRVAERERIARTLHDTILQSVQGIIFRLHLLCMDLPEGNVVRAALETMLAQADRTLSEGRDQIQELRRTFNADLPGLLTESGKRLTSMHPDIAFDLQVSGLPKTLRHELSEEIGEIAREAMRNAFRHSGANVIRVEITYNPRALLLRVTDNGRGIRPQVLSSDRLERNWGLTGMRERAGQIGAVLDIDSMPDLGTTVTLKVPVTRAHRQT